ncbi:MAG: hypothetical protein JNL21_19140 [Myxococcales bacterium]|jgi:hypothetical protein|nr:hypothetical protein [Myxococcales bacterium]
MNRTTKRVGLIGLVISACVATFAVTAFAEEKGEKGKCEHNGEARFKKADKNSDGFLTAAEVGDKKWARIKVADANADAKVSLAEMKQAKADGKLGHKGKGKKGKGKKKEGTEA